MKIKKQRDMKRGRLCRTCKRSLYTDAAGMREHESEHKLAQRAIAAGLVLPPTGIVIAKH